MAMEGKHVFGGVMIPRFKFVRDKHGEDGFEDLIDLMNRNGYNGPEDEEIFKTAKKYPFNYLFIFLESYLELYGVDEFSSMNRNMANEKGIVGFFVKWPTTPKDMIIKAGDYWPKFFDFGEFEGLMLEENKGVLMGKGVSPRPLFCRSLTDYFRGIVGNVEKIDFKIEHTHCVHRGDDRCDWTVSWKKRRDGMKQKI